ncbi:MAG: M23 family metallopeptidase [bacterium]
MSNIRNNNSQLPVLSKKEGLAKIARFIGLSSGKSLVVLLPIIMIMSMPNVTHAGILSFLSNLFSGNDASAQTDTYIQTPEQSASTTNDSEGNSQTMSLLESAATPDLTSTKTPVDVAITGNEALLPETGPSNTAPDIIEESNNGQINTYVVHKGDTVAAIAKMFDVSANTVLWANDLTKNSSLKEGQTLVILPITGVIHTVAKGDTLKSIAKKYGGDVDEIAQYNGLKVTDKLSIGDTVIVPDGDISSPAPATSKKPSTASHYYAGASGPEYVGYYMKPFVGGHKTQGLHGYNGVDYGMPIGTPLWAAASGKVIIAKNNGKYNGGYGNYVAIQHPNGTQTVYGHMSKVVVSVGDVVVQGQLIGYSGNTGKSTGPHLHFEIRGAKNPF